MRGKTRFAPHISHGDWFRTAPSLPAACHATAGRSSCNRPCAGAPSPNSHAPPESPADKRDAASPAAFVHHDIELRITGLKTPPRVEFQGSLADNRHHPVSPSQPARPTPTLTISDATLEARANPHDSVTAPQPHPLHARPDAAFGDVVSVRTRRGFHSPGSCPWPPLSALRRETTAQHAPASEADKRVPPTHSVPPKTQPNTGLHPHTNTLPARRWLNPSQGAAGASKSKEPPSCRPTAAANRHGPELGHPQPAQGLSTAPATVFHIVLMFGQFIPRQALPGNSPSQPGSAWEAHLSGYLAATSTSWESGLTCRQLILTREQHLS